MARRLTQRLRPIERELVAEIQYRRGLPPGDPGRVPLDDPVELVNYFIETKHGHARLRSAVLAAEIGVDLRRLERNFKTRYGRNVRQRQVEVRLDFALFLLGFFPRQRIADVAKTLGYTDVRNFNRFFQEHMGMSPTDWWRRQQDGDSRPSAIQPVRPEIDQASERRVDCSDCLTCGPGEG